jgi:replicative DNA helicase
VSEDNGNPDLEAKQSKEISIIKAGALELFENLNRATADVNGQWLIDKDPKRVLNDLTDIVDAMHGMIRENSTANKKPRQIAELLVEAERLATAPRLMSSIPGLNDAIGGGYHAGHTIMIGAFTSGGKTTASISQAAHSASHGHPTLYITLEISAVEVAAKLHRCLDGNSDSYSSLPLGIEDSYRSLEAIKDCVRRWVAEQDPSIIPVVIIDYLQKIRVEGSNGREREVAIVAEHLQELGREVKATLILSAQLNRESQKTDEEPQLYHFRESGLIEQAADVALLIWRPKDTDNQINVKIGKNRWGGNVGKKFELSMDFERSWFGSLNEYQMNERLINAVVSYLQTAGGKAELRYISSGIKLDKKHPKVHEIVECSAISKKYTIDGNMATLC